MKAALHRLVGYDPRTELERFEVNIPSHIFGDVGLVVAFDEDDPDAFGCYELTKDQAHRIAVLVHKRLPSGLDFFLEANAP